MALTFDQREMALRMISDNLAQELPTAERAVWKELKGIVERTPAVKPSIPTTWRCPECNALERTRERRPNGDSTCERGHKYPSSQAVKEEPALL